MIINTNLRWKVCILIFLNFFNKGFTQSTQCPTSSELNLLTPCYVNGSLTDNPNEDVIVLFNHTASRGESASKEVVANYAEVGTVWGLAYKPQTKKLYAAAFLKRHCDLSPHGLGAIYEIDLSTPTTAGAGTPTLWMDLNSTTHLGSGATLFPTETAANRGLAGLNVPNHDIWAYTRVGKQGLGDIEISEDGTKMYVMDLTNRQVLEISMATKIVTNRYAVNAPANYTNAADCRPFAIKHHNGDLYIGVVSSGETGVVKANLRGTIMKLSGNSFVTVLDMPTWDYREWPEPRYVGWNPYTDNDITDPATSPFSYIQYPVPLISDIEFDENDNMAIGVMDWSAHRVGAFNYAPELGNTNLYNIQVHGDIIKANKSGNSWSLESDIGNFYNDIRAKPQDGNTWPIETFMGGMFITNCNGTDLLVANIQDPFDLSSGGTAWMKTSNGLMQTNSGTVPADQQPSATAQSIIDGSRLKIYYTPSFTNAPSTFGKAAGLGDLIATISSASCTPPNTISFTTLNPTCNGGTPNNDGKITFVSITNSDKYFINNGTTSTGTYSTASPIPLSGTDIQTNIANTGGTYTIRFFNGSDACYKDTTVTINAVVCNTCACPSNLLENPSFETSDFSSWTLSTNDPNPTSFAGDNTYAACGNRYAFFNPTSGNITDYVAYYQDEPVSPGSVVSLSVYSGVHDPTQNHQIKLEFYSASNTLLSGGQTVQVDNDVDVPPTILQQYTLSGTAPAGTAYVRVTARAEGAYVNQSIAIKVDAFCMTTTPGCNLTVSTTGTNVYCNAGTNGTATATPSGNLNPVTYLWSNGATTQNISSLTAGTYSVTVTESANCTASATYTVTEPSAITVTCSKTDVTTSGGSNGTASVVASGGTSPYNYLWSNGSTTSSISGLVAGTYGVTVTDSNNCSASCSTTVNEPGCNLSATASGTNVSCNGGNNGTSTVTVSGNIGAVTYLWSNGGTTQTISTLTAGTYTVTVTESVNCITTSSYIVTQPNKIDAGQDQNLICNGSNAPTTANLGAAPVGQTWYVLSQPSNANATIDNSGSASNLTKVGDYIFELRSDIDANCKDSVKITVPNCLIPCPDPNCGTFSVRKL